MSDSPKIFPKLFIGDASRSFIYHLNKSSYGYKINYVSDRDELLSLIDTYSGYKNYKLPVIISDISYFNHNDQSLLLKFMDDTTLDLILLASRDNILDTIISRVREFRKFYIARNGSAFGFISPSKARKLMTDELNLLGDKEISLDDKLLMSCKYNSLLAYDDSITNKFNLNDKGKLLSMLEFSNE